jgi:hypothetical protein
MNILKFLVIGSLVIGNLASAGTTVDHSKAEAEAWKITCKYSNYPCKVSQPYTIYTDLTPLSAFGVYFGGNTIYLDIGLSPETEPRNMGTLVHEMVHYLQAKEGGITVRGIGRVELCLAEVEAYQVMNKWFADIGVEPVNEWRGC